MDGERGYPAHWAADVVLRDGGTAHLRPILPSDAGRLRRFFARLSDQTIYYRFFALYRSLSDQDVTRFTVVDHQDRAALVATIGPEMVGVVRYERTGPDEAEVAFTIEDAHQGRGLGSVLLEHIAAAARERGIARFVADVLPANRAMLRVFREAGYVVHQSLDDGIVRLSFDLAPTEDSLAVTYAREHRAEARSVARLLQPASVAVLGAGTPLGRAALRHLRSGGYAGRLHVVGRADAGEVPAGCPATIREVPGPVDLAVVAVPAAELEDVLTDCAASGVRGLLVLSEADGEQRLRHLLGLARGSGMRLVGPASYGLLNTDPDVSLNASRAAGLPARGRMGFFCQSGAVGFVALDQLRRLGLGVSTFISAGERLDVSGNDVLQYWEQDTATDAVVLVLESLGNPRKFSRLARRLAQQKPVLVLRSGRVRRERPGGQLVREPRAPAAAVEALFQRAGVIRADSVPQLFEVAALLAAQPLPAGRCVGVVSNDPALARLTVDACADAGLVVVRRADLAATAGVDDLGAAVAKAVGDDAADAVLVAFVAPLEGTGTDLARALVAVAAASGRTVLATLLGLPEAVEALRRGADPVPADPVADPVPADPVPADPVPAYTVPVYAWPADAVRALAKVTAYARWRATPAGHTVSPSGLDVRAARGLVAELLGDQDEERLDHGALQRLLGCYGIPLWDVRPVASVAAAVAAAAELGYPVAVKATAAHLRHRRELGGVVLDLPDAAAVRRAYRAIRTAHGAAAGEVVVQAMAPTGVATRLATIEDPLLGPVVSFGLGGVATDLLGDRTYGVPPLTDRDLAELVRGVGAAPLLLGHAGSEPVDLAALEDLLARLGRLSDDLPEVAALELNPVVAAPGGAAVLAAVGRLARPRARPDRGVREMGG